MPSTVINRDSFTRSNQSGWGAADDGQTYTTTLGTPVLSIEGNQGVITGFAGQSFIQAGNKTSQDINFYASVGFDNNAMTAIGIYGRQTGPDTLYRARINSSANTFALVKTVAGTSTDLASVSFTPTLNTLYRIRLKIVNDRLYARIWLASASEPTDWTLKAQDASITGPGGIGFNFNCLNTTGRAWFANAYALNYEAGSFSDLTISDKATVTPNVAAPAATVPSPNVLGRDSFTRSDQSGWNPATDGQNWAITSGSGTLSIVSNQGQVTGSTGQNFIQLGSKTSENFNIVVTVKADNTAISSIGITARQTAATTLYRARLNNTTNTFAIVKTIANTSTDLASVAFTSSINTAYKIRFKGVKDRLYARIWLATGQEPTNWTVQAQDASITGPGGFGVTAFCTSATGKMWLSDFYALDYEAGSLSLSHFNDAPKQKGTIRGASNLTVSTSATVTATTTTNLVRGYSSLTITTQAKLQATNRAKSNSTIQDRASLKGKRTGTSNLTVQSSSKVTPKHLEKMLLSASTSAKVQGVNRGKSSLTITVQGGVQIKPVVLPDGVSVWIEGEQIRYKEASLSINSANKQRKTASFTIYDPTGTKRYDKGTKVEVKHNILGTIFSGVVNDATENNLYPNPDNEIKIRCIDKSWYPLKRLVKRDYANQYAGFIFTDLLDSISDEGITANYAARRDLDQTSLAQGTLSNVVATPDGLELAPAGVDVSHTFGGAVPAAAPAIKLTGTAAIPGSSNQDAYRAIWKSSTGLTLTDHDTLIYSIWVSGDSAEVRGGVDLSFTDGTNLRNLPLNIAGTDQNGLHPSPESDLTGLADNQWYTRLCGLSNALAGKTISTVTVGLEAFKPGNYTIYVRDIHLLDQTTGTARQIFFNGTLQQTIPPTTRQTGFKNVTLSVVDAYDISNYKFINVIDDFKLPLDDVKIARDSLITWTQDVPDNAEVHVYASVDDKTDFPTTWQECTNNAPIPSVIPGMNVTGQILRLTYVMNTKNPDPTLPTRINAPAVTVYTSYNSTKTDVVKTYLHAADFDTGTYSNLKMVPGVGFYLQLDGFSKNYEDADQSSEVTVAGVYGVNNRQLDLHTATANGFVIVRLDWIGEQANFIYEASLKIEDHGRAGVIYRTDTFNGTDTYAYAAMVGTTSITLDRGTDGGVSTALNLGTVGLTLTSGDWHILRVEAIGSSHKIYLDGVLMITATDATHTSGKVALRYKNTNNTAEQHQFMDDIGYAKNALSGTWTSGDIDLSSTGTYGGSIVRYAIRPDLSSDLISFTLETSLDNGATWQVCQEGGEIPSFTPGMSLAGKKLKARMTLATTNPSVIPYLWGLTLWVMGKYSATGTRVSPALDLSTAGRAGSSLVSSNATVPTGTALQIQAGPNTSAWSTVSSGDALPFLTHQTDPLTDPFDTDSSAGYTLLTRSGGQQAVPTWDTTNGRLIITGGLESVLRAASVDFQDGEVWIDVKQSDQGGIVLRCQDANNYYDVAIYDDVSSVQTNIIQLYRVAAGSRQLLAVAPIDFQRGTPKRVRAVIVGGKITVYFDGLVVIDHTDTTPLLVSGKTGFRAGYTQVAGSSYYQSIRIQGYGEDLTGKQAYSKLTLTSTDARYTPIVPNLILLCNNPDIAVGALIKETKYAYDKTVADAFDDLASKSSCNWDITADNKASFLPPTASPAPWIASTESADLLLGIEVERSGDLYRNWQFVKGCIDTIIVPESFVADGKATSWSLGYPVNEAPTITVNGIAATVGLKGETGKDFYYEIGSPTIAQDESAIPIAKGLVIVIVYQGQVRKTVEAKDDNEIAARKLVEDGSGIVENVYDATDQNLSIEAGQQLAQSLLDEYKKIGTTVRFGTLKHGLAPGQLLPLTVSQHGIQDALHLITSVNISIDTRSRESVAIHQAAYDVECTDGPDIGNWIHLYRKK